ncbi:MAG: flavin reductase [Longicatena sp.]
MDQKALYKLSYGLYIISSSENGLDVGCVANTLHQVTSSPMQLSITLNKDNVTQQVIDRTKKFDAVVLTQECNLDVIGTFGFHSSKDVDKFEKVAFKRDDQGIPYLIDHCASRFSCQVVAQLDLGTHVTFIGEVKDAEVLNNEEVMTYAYYHQVKNGTTPKNAPSFQEAPASKGWRCSICGYIYEGEDLPSDFICPICKAPASVFEKLE